MFSRSTVKLPASIWCSGAGVAPASPAIKGESSIAITLNLRPFEARIGALLLS